MTTTTKATAKTTTRTLPPPPRRLKPSASPPTPGQKVEVSAGGTEFEPAVPVDSIPDGSWACVMDGKVHYAATEKGAGECTVCGMNLTQTGGEKQS